MGQSSKIVVGRKEAVLTAEEVYSVAYQRCVVELDLSSSGSPAQKISILPYPVDSPKGVQLLPDVEVRAILVVLLHKLVGRLPGIRPFLPVLVTEILNLGLTVEIPVSNDDSAVIKAFVSNVYNIKRRLESAEDEKDGVLKKLRSVVENYKPGEIGITGDEMAALESSSAGSIGLAALSLHSLNTLVGFADAVTALSCEALLANTEAFKPDAYKQTFSRKSEADVARDLSSLLFGSKLAKENKQGLDEDYIRNVPAAHGALRDAVSILASRLRVDMNRVEITNKKSYSCSSSLFTSTMLPLLVSLWPLISDSFDRTSKCVECVRTLNLESGVKGWKSDEDSADKFTSLKRGVQLAASVAAVSGDENAVFLSRETLSTIETWRRMLVEECTVSLELLSLREPVTGGPAQGQDVEQRRVSEQGSNKAGVNGDVTSIAAAKAAKKKNNFVLGKGSEIVRSSLRGFLNSGSTGNFQSIDSVLHPHTPELQALVTNLKTVLESVDVRRLPKTAKGTRDFKPEQMVIREKAFGIITAIFKRHGAASIDTPVFELKETLMGKYGEDSKLIYDLADQGGEILSLRYDLTVPFARYLAMNKVENLKRYHIARVYRRDNPSNGRYREFYQCDMDIAGRSQNPMVYDFEVLKVLTELLDELDIGEYEVKLNHRKLLDGMLNICGVPQSKFRSICSAIDKLDKLPWDQVKKEMVEEKGLQQEVADKIGGLVQKRGNPWVLLEELQQVDSPFSKDPSSVAALEELGVLFKYLTASKCINRIVFDLSLARGLDYYTGVIYEAIFKGSTQVGSIAAGGRYDDLVGMFSGKQVPAVGVSLGIERVFAIMEKQEEDRKTVLRSNETQVLVVVLGKDERWTEEAIKIVTDLWEGRLKAEFACVAPKKIVEQITKAEKSGIPYLVIVGEDELTAGRVRLKDIFANKQEDIQRVDLVRELQTRVGIL
ncbi:unnamed protein product [Calypogeia fissa]